MQMASRHLLAAVLAILAASQVHALRPLPSLAQWLSLGKSSAVNADGDLWALLIAGSAGWGNYRHQADIAHAYQVLHRGGVRDEHIVVMVFDDIAHNPNNPYPGSIVNHPSGGDVYAGMPRDYTANQVTTANFLAVLAGNQTALGVGSHSGRVISAGPADRIFVYYSDHGAPGILGMPSGDFLYADQINKVIQHRAAVSGFKEMVLYVEACESGSIFEGLLADDLPVYATTAANAHESSWGVYCPGMEPSPPEGYDTCLGDLYSVAWLEDADANDLRAETLKLQYQLVRQRTSQNYSYNQGSHVQRFGDFEMSEEPAARYEGADNDGSQAAGLPASQRRLATKNKEWSRLQAMPQREADLVPLATASARHRGTPAGEEAQRQLDDELARRQALDDSVYNAVAMLMEQHVPGSAGDEAALQAFVTTALPRPEGAALVDDWDCLRGMMAAWGGACGALDQYGMRHSRAFANLCNQGVQPAELAAAATATGCGGNATAQAAPAA